MAVSDQIRQLQLDFWNPCHLRIFKKMKIWLMTFFLISTKMFCRIQAKIYFTQIQQ